jgi:hypothetical protein
MGNGMLFGLAGAETRTEGVVIGLVLGVVTIVSAVCLMLVRETRWLSIAIAVSSVLGTLAAGQLFGFGAALAFVGAIVATRVDRTAPLYGARSPLGSKAPAASASRARAAPRGDSITAS